ncbi:hypothetical protein HY522_07000 [bacterium]|nr:hypothetical protein [bacterium]
MEQSGNSYCEGLGIPIPRVEDVMKVKGVILYHLMVVALLEKGGPLTLQDIVSRLSGAGVTSPIGNLSESILKSWHGRNPVFRDADGRFGLNLVSRELDFILMVTNLRQPVRYTPEPPIALEQKADDVPLSEKEVEVAFRARTVSYFSNHRMAAAVLDAMGRSMTLDEMNQYLMKLTNDESIVNVKNLKNVYNTLVAVDGTGQLSLISRAGPDIETLRRWVRKIAGPRLVYEAHSEQIKRNMREREKAEAENNVRQAAEAVRLRRAVLYAIPEGAAPRAVGVLDIKARTIRTFLGDELSGIPAVLAEYDLLVGLHTRDALYRLNLDPTRWMLVDLKPPQKTKKINRQGRILHITPELLIRGTTGISRPLGDPAMIAHYLAKGDEGRLRRRIESTVKALYAFYNYGVLNRFVRLRWGFLDEILAVDWAHPGDPLLYKILQEANRKDSFVDIVAGGAPGWTDPWSRAMSVQIVRLEYWTVTVRQGDEIFEIDRHDIQAVRPSRGFGLVTSQ